MQKLEWIFILSTSTFHLDTTFVLDAMIFHTLISLTFCEQYIYILSVFTEKPYSKSMEWNNTESHNVKINMDLIGLRTVPQLAEKLCVNVLLLQF